MKRDIPIGKTFRFPCLVERIVMRNAAVDGEKDLLCFFGHLKEEKYKWGQVGFH